MGREGKGKGREGEGRKRKREGREGEGKEEGEGNGREGEDRGGEGRERDEPPLSKSWIRRWFDMGTSAYVITYRSYKRLITGRFLAHPVYIHAFKYIEHIQEVSKPRSVSPKPADSCNPAASTWRSSPILEFIVGAGMV